MILNLVDYVSDNDTLKQLKVDGITVVEYKCQIDKLASGYWTDQNYLVYVTSGQKKWNSDTQEWQLGVGEAAFIKRGYYLSENLGGDEFCAILIFLPDSCIVNTLKRHEVKFDGPIKPQNICNVIEPFNMKEDLKVYFSAMEKYLSLNEPPPIAVMRLQLEELILRLVSSPVGDGIYKYFQYLLSVEKVSIEPIMEANYHRHLKTEDFARLCGRSLSAFRRDFVKIYNQKPGQWLLERRLNKAAYLLRSTQLPVVDLCYECGFSNQSHFTRAFKDLYGLAPLESRKSSV